MKAWLLTALLLTAGGLPGWHWLLRVREHNEAQARGQAAAARGQVAEAAYYFGQAAALSGRGGPAPTLLLALAQAQARAGQASAAEVTYSQLLGAAVPPALGSAARQQLAVLLARRGQPAQALGLLRQALRLNPRNLPARYDYEVLGHYLTGHPTPPPTVPDSAASPVRRSKAKPDSASARQPGGPGGGSPGQPKAAPAPQPGRDGAAPNPNAPGSSGPPPPTANGSGADNGRANGGRRPGNGPQQPQPTGSQAGPQRGVGADGTDTGGAGGRPGTQAAAEADAQLQTQRERLRALSLTPAQAQQLLDALQASEQQYLQQRPHARRGPPPTPGQPTW